MTAEPVPVTNYRCAACGVFVGKRAAARERHVCRGDWGDLRAVWA